MDGAWIQPRSISWTTFLPPPGRRGFRKAERQSQSCWWQSQDISAPGQGSLYHTTLLPHRPRCPFQGSKLTFFWFNWVFFYFSFFCFIVKSLLWERFLFLSFLQILCCFTLFFFPCNSLMNPRTPFPQFRFVFYLTAWNFPSFWQSSTTKVNYFIISFSSK